MQRRTWIKLNQFSPVSVIAMVTEFVFVRVCVCVSERISMRQSQVDKLYAGLKDLSEERRGKLDERLRLFQLNREVDDLEQWIAEREVVAGSHELGQDYEHVTVRYCVYFYY